MKSEYNLKHNIQREDSQIDKPPLKDLYDFRFAPSGIPEFEITLRVFYRCKDRGEQVKKYIVYAKAKTSEEAVKRVNVLAKVKWPNWYQISEVSVLEIKCRIKEEE